MRQKGECASVAPHETEKITLAVDGEDWAGWWVTNPGPPTMVVVHIDV